MKSKLHFNGHVTFIIEAMSLYNKEVVKKKGGEFYSEIMEILTI